MQNKRRKMADPEADSLTTKDLCKQLNRSFGHVCKLARDGVISGAYRASGRGTGGSWYFKPNWRLDPVYEKFKKRA